MTSIATPRHESRRSEDAETERLYAEYSDRILAYCLRRVGSRTEAEDAVQVTFLCAFRALRRGVVPESESAWLHAIAKNVCRWQLRTASRRPLPGSVALESVASPQQDEDTELLVELRDALETLPDRQRDALLMREWRGLSAHEIAERLDLSASATHALLTRARRSLAYALTAPQRAALGLASLAYELRSWIKAAVGGASAKAALATMAVAGGVGVVTIDGGAGQADPGSTPAPAAVDGASPASFTGPALGSGTSAGAAGAGASGGPGTLASFGPELRGSATDRETMFRLVRPGVGGVGPTSDPATPSDPPAPPGSAAPPGSTAPNVPSASAVVSAPDLPKPPPLPVLDPPPIDPPDLPPLPTIDLPPVDLPPLGEVDVPPVVPPDLPQLPTVDLPPVVPPDPPVLPEVDLPPLPPLPKLP